MNEISEEVKSGRIGLVKIKKGKPRKLVAGRNTYTSTRGHGWPQEITDEDAYRALANKPGMEEF